MHTIFKCKKLKIIVRHGVGYDNVDLKYLNSKKIALGITSTSNAVSVAEHVLTMFLYLAKRIYKSDNLSLFCSKSVLTGGICYNIVVDRI